MQVELTIQEMFENFPALFKERADCLNHLFCTIGNGYEWINGELVYGGIHCHRHQVYCDCSEKEKIFLETRLVNGKAFQHTKLSLRAEAIYAYNKGLYPNEILERLNFNEDYFNRLPDDVYYKKPRQKRWYFYIDIPGKERIDYHKKYAKLFNYPKDIKPDWLEAIEECKILLREDGFDV